MKKGYFTLLFAVLIAFANAQVTIADPTANKGKVEWQWRAEVGEVPFGIPVSAEFKVKNVSNEPLLLREVKSGCKCTITDFTREPILPNSTGIIKAVYDAKHEGDFYKIITVLTNFDETNMVTLAVQGKVKK